MANNISPRLLEIIHALPLREGMRVLETGCGPGAMVRESRPIGNGHILAIDRSSKAIQLAISRSQTEIGFDLRWVTIKSFFH